MDSGSDWGADHDNIPSSDSETPEQKGFENDRTEYEIRLQQEIIMLKHQLQSQQMHKESLYHRNEELEKENNYLKQQLELLQNEYRETLADLGQLTVEQTAKANEERKSELFQQLFCTSQLASTSRIESKDKSSTRQSFDNLSIRQDDPGTRLGTTTLHHYYNFLLLSLSESLLSFDVVKLKDWANQNFSIENPENATDVLFQLDQKGIINVSDLCQLSDFFESIVRFDLVYIIDGFLDGDYSLLRNPPTSNRRDVKANDLTSESGEDRYPSTSRKEGNNETQNALLLQSRKAIFSNFSAQQNTKNPIPFPIFPNEIPPTGQYEVKARLPGFNSTRMAALADGPLTSEMGTKSDKSSKETNPLMTNQAGNTQTFGNAGSNGFKLSKFLRPGAEESNSCNSQFSSACLNQDSDNDQDGNWLCNHYKRRCYVKFECCDKFWPCHRCHNNQSACYQKKLKARDAEMVKCVKCRKVQQFGPFCCDCGANFADYYCGLCKHLTGKDEDPYHCEKCGTCRIHRERSFHCDTCGVCLDNQLIGNHYCREESAHDECCICLEDAFTGCQILPCSHKVHKECATHMIRNGITRCPICRKSFVSQLKRRSTWNSRRRNSGN